MRTDPQTRKTNLNLAFGIGRETDIMTAMEMKNNVLEAKLFCITEGRDLICLFRTEAVLLLLCVMYTNMVQV